MNAPMPKARTINGNCHQRNGVGQSLMAANNAPTIAANPTMRNTIGSFNKATAPSFRVLLSI